MLNYITYYNSLNIDRSSA